MQHFFTELDYPEASDAILVSFMPGDLVDSCMNKLSVKLMGVDPQVALVSRAILEGDHCLVDHVVKSLENLSFLARALNSCLNRYALNARCALYGDGTSRLSISIAQWTVIFPQHGQSYTEDLSYSVSEAFAAIGNELCQSICAPDCHEIVESETESIARRLLKKLEDTDRAIEAWHYSNLSAYAWAQCIPNSAEEEHCAQIAPVADNASYAPVASNGRERKFLRTAEKNRGRRAVVSRSQKIAPTPESSKFSLVSSVVRLWQSVNRDVTEMFFKDQATVQ